MIRKKLLGLATVMLIVATSSLYSYQSALAAGAVMTTDTIAQEKIEKANADANKGVLEQLGKWTRQFADTKFYEDTFKKIISNTYGQVLNTALKQMAKDSATWIASGGKGQKPMFITQGWGGYLKNVGDAVAGQFIETVAKELVSTSPLGQLGEFSFCNPNNFNVAVKIGLGLRAQEVGQISNCTFTRIRNNIDSYTSDPNFLYALQNSFDPTSNDVGLALSLNSWTKEYALEAKNAADKERTENKGWLRVESLLGNDAPSKFLGVNLGAQYEKWKAQSETGTNSSNVLAVEEAKKAYDECMKNAGVGPTLAGAQCMDQVDFDIVNKYVELEKLDAEAAQEMYADVPGSAQKIIDNQNTTLSQRMLSSTGYALVDAANVFINQLALTAFEELMKKIGGSSGQEGANWDQSFWNSLANKNAAPYNSGIVGASIRTQKTIYANYTTRADYDILAQLSVCPNPLKAGPNECVIDDKFRQAIQDRKTIGQAVKDGTLPGDRIFGFQTKDAEPKYNEGFPYRSMLILRKYRIIPAGWEVAAQYIHEHLGDANVRNPMTLQQMIECFDANDEYAGYSDSWCSGLVDPNWVLKSGKNFCGKVGIGPQITSSNVDSQGKLMISRKDDYCADDQSCIKEKDDGSCELYGYCAEDRRSWTFGTKAKQCTSVYNTCQTFRNGKTGNTEGYLKNTLDFSNCTADVVGCAGYCTANNPAYFSFDASTNRIVFGCTATTSSPDRLFFDDNAKTCSSDSEGCRQLIRVTDNSGANLLLNGDFEDVNEVGDLRGYWVDGAGLVGVQEVGDANSGSSSLKMAAGAHRQEVTVGLDAYQTSFVLSFASKGCQSSDTVTLETLQTLANGSGGSAALALGTSSDPDWSYHEISHLFDSYSEKRGKDAEVVLNWNITSANCLIDTVKLERGLKATSFSVWGQTANIFEKVAPSYLRCTGLETDPRQCGNFVRRCSEGEVGCELYTSQTDGTAVPGKVNPTNYCVSECVGYKEYMQTKTAFETVKPQYFLPNSAKKCSAQEVGCDEFTNLDKLAQGGEAVEYYTNLRQCVKKSEPTCTNYYVWEGVGNAGYQLNTITLKAAGTGTTSPAVTSDDAAECNETIYNLDPSDPNYSPDCREFYDSSGNKFYHLLSRTIACDDNCHPYRRSDLDVIWDVSDQATCSSVLASKYADEGYFDATKNQCMVCPNGGTMINRLDNNAQRYCVYNAVPEQSAKCAASSKGCREYTGTNGENMQIMFTDDFEGAETANWTNADQPSNSKLSDDALRQGGHSFEVGSAAVPSSMAIYKNISSQIDASKSYALSFLAKGATTLDIYLASTSGAAPLASFGSVTLEGRWLQFELSANLDQLLPANYQLTGDEVLVIDGGNADSAGENAYLMDDIRLTEISGRYHLVKESWRTPESCDQDLWGNDDLHYMLNCDRYKDRAGTTRYLRSFAQLCSESGVGCELMIDTFNSDSPYAATSSQGVVTPADAFDYIVYDKSKQCSRANKGCERFGKMDIYANVQTSFVDAYVLNNPDTRETAMCVQDNLGCASWAGQSGTAYFKDPGNNVCEFRQVDGSSSPAWLKREVKLCGTASSTNNTKICSSDADCAGQDILHQTCSARSGVQPCATDRGDKTVGEGGSMVEQPRRDANQAMWAGICPAEESGCTEYVDPASKPSTNIVFNPSFEELDNNAATQADGWTPSGANFTQNISLDNFSMYVLGAKVNSGSINLGLSCPGAIQVLDPTTNNFVGGAASLQVGTPQEKNIRFRTQALTGNCVLTSNANNNAEVFVRKAVVAYELEQTVDKTSCNGLVNYSEGCVEFNERSLVTDGNSSGNLLKYKPLLWDADINYFNASEHQPVAGAAADKDANVILKVNADRKCNKWLTCSSKISYQDNNGVEQSYCSSLAMCDQLNGDGSCAHVTKVDQNAQKFFGSGGLNKYANYTGYSKVGLHTQDDVQMTGFYAIDRMDQVGDFIRVPNGDFETHTVYQEDKAAGREGRAAHKPASWDPADGQVWDSSHFEAVTDAVSAQKEGIRYPISGRSFIKVGAGRAIKSDMIHISTGATYRLTFSANTKNLSSSSLTVRLVTSNGTAVPGASASIREGLDWTSRMVTITSNATPLYIRVETAANSVGRYYLDNFQIKPVALISDRGGAYYRAPECRLYPKEDALACEYAEESGLKAKGLYGYCLEYDRAPGDPSTCLQWWPGDRIRGDGIAEEGIGYQGPTPLYYCAEAQALLPIVKTPEKIETASYSVGLQCSSGGYSMNCVDYAPYINQVCPPGTVKGFNETPIDGCNKMCHVTCTVNSFILRDGENVWIEYPGKMGGLGAPFPDYLDFKEYDEVSRKFYDTRMAYCTKIARVVTESGENKFWSGRIYPNSKYVVPSLNYKYPTVYYPFSSLIGPTSFDPYNWDGDDDSGGADPILMLAFKDKADRAKSVNTMPYTLNNYNGRAVNPYIGYCVDSFQVNNLGNTNVSPTTGSYDACLIDASSTGKLPDQFKCGAGEACAKFPVKNNAPVNALNSLQNMYAASYGVWDYNFSAGRYQPANQDWTAPTALCTGNESPYHWNCGNAPRVFNVSVNGKATSSNPNFQGGQVTGNYVIHRSGFAQLLFNTSVDLEQRPLVMYEVKWGDGITDRATGVYMSDRSNPEYPHAISHLLDYWTLKAKDTQETGIACSALGSCIIGGVQYQGCSIRPGVLVKDNWNFCSNNNNCGVYTNASTEIVVCEK